MLVKIGICLAGTYLGLHAPMLFLKNAIGKRQLSIKRAFPDALDLLLICVESGMSVEVAFRKVATEIVSQSVALSEEFTLTTAELSYLQDRKVAYENLANRTGLDGVKSVCLALQQSERYGTPLGQSLRVMAQENRDMNEAEEGRRAAEDDRADDPVLPAVPVHHPRPELHQGWRCLSVIARARSRPA
jgi:tight adherence protein C